MEFFASNKKFWIASSIALSLALLLFAFKAGATVGARRASFACRWTENYHRNFAGPREGFSVRSPKPDFIESHGAFGRVLRVDADALVIKRPNGAEEVVEVVRETEILRLRSKIALPDVRVGEEAVVIGRPTEDGRIRAGLIRLMPAGR